MSDYNCGCVTKTHTISDNHFTWTDPNPNDCPLHGLSRSDYATDGKPDVLVPSNPADGDVPGTGSESDLDPKPGELPYEYVNRLARAYDGLAGRADFNECAVALNHADGRAVCFCHCHTDRP